MNIYFKDKKLFEQLKKATLAKVKVGSHMYGTNNKKSDIDWLYIYATSENELLSAIQTHHQLQYNENDIDHNFVSLHNFIKNCISGDSTINFEVIHSDKLYNTGLRWLSNMKKSFITYTIIKSYLGFAKRDIKYYYKQKNDYDKRKRLSHIIRGYIYARMMLDNEFDFDKANKYLLDYNIQNINVSKNFELKNYIKLISSTRSELNKRFNNHTLGLAQHFDVNSGIKLTNELTNFCKLMCFKEKQYHLKDFKLDMFINSFENWVKY